MAFQAKGTERSQEVRPDKLRPDTRTGFTKVFAGLHTTGGVGLALGIIVFLTMMLCMLPFMVEMTLFWLWFIYMVWVKPGNRKWDFPYRVPSHANVNDGSYSKRKKGEGIAFFGVEISTKLEIWAAKPDIGTHLLLIGTTGSGKTEALLGIAFNSLVHLSSFAFIDGKGDPKLWENVFRLAKILNRHFDLLQLSFLTGGVNYAERQETKVTNTCAPYSTGSDAVISELQIAQMDDSGGGKGGDMWKGRAIAFVQAINRPLVYQRDQGHILLNPNAYIPYFDLGTLERYALDLVALDSGGSEIRYENDEMFKTLIKPLSNFVTTLPGYHINNKGQQEQKTLEQFGYITMQLTRLWNDMSYTYGHIYGAGLGEIYMYDVVLNRRILVGAIPALERSTDTLSMLGKIVIGQIKQMMGGALGNRVEGITRVIIDSRPTNAKFPFQVILDEYGYYICVGFACAVAQARSLGFSITIATQDLSSLKKGSPEEADATWENTNIRMIGRITSGRESETWRKVSGLVEDATVEMIGGKEFKSGDLSDRYTTNRDTRFEKVARLTYDDIAGQENGEFTILVGKKNRDGTQGTAVIRARTFYTETKRPREIRLNHFLPVEPPSITEVKRAKGERAIDKSVAKTIKSGLWARIIPDTKGGSEYEPFSSADRIKRVQVGMEIAKREEHAALLREVGGVSPDFGAVFLSFFAFAVASMDKSDRYDASLESITKRAQTASPQQSPTIVNAEGDETAGGEVAVKSAPIFKNTFGAAPPAQPEVAVTAAPVTPVPESAPLPVAEADVTKVPVPEPRTYGTSRSDGVVRITLAAYLQEIGDECAAELDEFEAMELNEDIFEPIHVSKLSGSVLSQPGAIENITKITQCMLMTSGYGKGGDAILTAKAAAKEVADSIEEATAYYRGAVPDPEPREVFMTAVSRIKQLIQGTQE